jgi:NAD(P)-dependent dehydrogenase (short-subunit alcohol dehydrogenase family)
MKLDGSMAAIISGGASGLGEATARRLAKKGVRVAVLDMSADRGAAVARDINGLFCKTDVTDRATVAAAIAEAQRILGPVRLAVSCAGIFRPMKTIARNPDTAGISAHDAANFGAHIAINLTGTFNLASLAAANMAELEPATPDGGRGTIICTSSIAAEEGQIGQVAYAASKAGVSGMVLPMARDLARDGIRVAAILPGIFETPMMAGLMEAARRSLAASVPFPARLGQPQEYAALVEHIAENEMLNGCCIRLDGALRMAPK